ncbi:MAG: peptidoglycan DD-metalloendopeptidase family protein [Thermoleophilaceae bacterium]|nr:peptidoglycan DD-metalloendopeptidase family protein [Thermoleophilaceae bacterium]
MRMKRAFWVSLCLAVAAYLLLPMPGISEPLQQRIEKARQKVAEKKRKEGVLTSDISAYNLKIRGLQGDIRSLQARQSRLQSQLDDKRRELARVQDRLQAAQDRLARLRARLESARRVLAERLVEIYKSDEPDLVTVVLEANGFQDLLDRASFMQRISDQDHRVITTVRDLKAQAASQAVELARLDRQVQAAADAIAARRNEVAAAKGRLVDTRTRLQRARDGRRTLLARLRHSRHRIEEDLSAMEAEQARIRSQLNAGGGGGGGLPAGPIRRGSGQFIWPVNGPITSPFCETRSWERCHPGIDIGVPSGTPIRAAGSGVVAIAGPVSGYGNFTCINHGGGLSTCYGHQSSIHVHVGQHVSQGQVIGLSGCTGLCFGPHLHFEVRVNGSVTNPLNYL